MALKLDDKPTDSRDDQLNPQHRVHPDGSHENVGLSKSDEDSFNDIVNNYDKTAEAEKNASINDGQGSTINGNEQAAQERANDTLGSGYKPDKNEKKKRKLSMRARVGLGFGGVGVIAGIIAFVGLVQGPFQLLQFSQLLQKFHFSPLENLGDDRTSKLTILYRYSRNGTIQGTRLGTISRIAAGAAELRMIQDAGLRPVYDKTNGRMAGYEVIDEDKASRAIRELEGNGGTSQGERGNFERVDGSDTGTENRIIAIDDKDGKRRGAVRTVVRTTDLGKVSSVVASRLLIKLGGIGVDFHPLEKVQRKAAEPFLEFRRKYQENRKEELKRGVAAPTANRVGAVTEDAEGNPVGDPDNSVDVELGNEASQQSQAAVDGDADGRNGRLFNLGKEILGKAAGPAAVVGVLCAVKDLGDQAEDIQYANTILPMIRTGFRWMSIGSQLQSLDDLSLDELNVNIQDLYDPELGGVMAAASIQHEEGLPATGPDIDPAIKPSGVDGKPALLEDLDDVPGLGTACNVTNAIAGLPIISQVGSVAEGVVNSALGSLGLPTPEDIMLSIATWLSGEAVNLNAVGATLGNIANYGARLAANSLSIASGGLGLTPLEVSQLDEWNREIELEEIRSTSFFARMFDLNSTDSLFATIFRGASTQTSDYVPSFTAYASAFSAPLSLATGTASAQAGNYDYGFDEVGFSLSEINDERIQDPYENAKIVEEDIGLENLTQYAQCFPNKIDPETFELIVDTNQDAVSQFNQPDECTSPEALADENYLRYRIYLYDTVTAHSLNCYEGVAESCEQIGFTSNVAIGSEADPNQTGGLSCEEVTGNEKIACAAQDYLGVRYANYNSGTGTRWLDEWGVSDISGSLGQRPKEWVEERIIGGENDFMECSGFTNVAIYAAYGVEIGPTCSAGYLDKTDFFVQIDPSEAQPGDFLIKSRTCGNNGHIGIFYAREGGSIKTLESSAGRNDSGERKSGFYTRSPDYYPYAVRYIGPGAGE